MLIQQLQEQIDRSLVNSPGDADAVTFTDLSDTLVAAEAAKAAAEIAQTAAELAETNAEIAQTAAELAETNAAASAAIAIGIAEEDYPEFLGLNNGTYNIALPTNAMAAAIFMLGNADTIIWMYLNAAPPGWKVLATGADTVLAVSGGAGLYNANGGTAGGESWANLKAHVHAGPEHAHDKGTLAGPNHTHTLASAGTTSTDKDLGLDVALNAGKLSGMTAGSSALTIASATTGNPSATALTGEMANAGTGNTGAQSTSDVRPTASIGKLFQLDTA